MKHIAKLALFLFSAVAPLAAMLATGILHPSNSFLRVWVLLVVGFFGGVVLGLRTVDRMK